MDHDPYMIKMMEPIIEDPFLEDIETREMEKEFHTEEEEEQHNGFHEGYHDTAHDIDLLNLKKGIVITNSVHSNLSQNSDLLRDLDDNSLVDVCNDTSFHDNSVCNEANIMDNSVSDEANIMDNYASNEANILDLSCDVSLVDVSDRVTLPPVLNSSSNRVVVDNSFIDLLGDSGNVVQTTTSSSKSSHKSTSFVPALLTKSTTSTELKNNDSTKTTSETSETSENRTNTCTLITTSNTTISSSTAKLPVATSGSDDCLKLNGHNDEVRSYCESFWLL